MRKISFPRSRSEVVKCGADFVEILDCSESQSSDSTSRFILKIEYTRFVACSELNVSIFQFPSPLLAQKIDFLQKLKISLRHEIFRCNQNCEDSFPLPSILQSNST